MKGKDYREIVLAIREILTSEELCETAMLAEIEELVF